MRLTIISKEEFSYAMLIASLIFGGFSYPLYSLLIALANDFLKPGMFVKASATLLTINGIGSVIGPFIAAFFMYIFGYFGLIYFLILLYLIISGTAYYRLIRGRKIPENTAGTFVVIPETSPSLYNSDPRFEESKKEKEVNLKEGKEVKKRKGQKP
jgi:MFS family permease